MIACETPHSKFMPMPLFYLLFFYLLLSPFPLHASAPYQPVMGDAVDESWRWASLHVSKGLRCLAEAEDGTIWFGTNAGVRCYDGWRWTTYTPKDGLLGAPINALCATRDGRMVAGSDAGISQFVDGAWHRVFPTEGDLTWPIDRILEAADGSLWAGTGWGALHLKGTEATVYTSKAMGRVLQLLAPYVRPVFVPDETVPPRFWRDGVGVRVVQGSYPGISRGHMPMVIWAVAPESPGAIAGLKPGDYILEIDGEMPDLPHLALDGDAGTSVSLMVKRGKGAPFEVTLTRGQVTGNFQEFSISDLLEDHRGHMWFGLAWGGEIVRYNPGSPSRTWRLYTMADGFSPGDRPRMIQAQDGTIWAVSNHFLGGVNRFDPSKDNGSWTQAWLSEIGGDDVHTAIQQTQDGAIWIGGHSGMLYIFRQDDDWTVWRPPVTPVSRPRVIDLLETAEGKLWIAHLGEEVTQLDYAMSRWTTFEGLNYQCKTADGKQWFVSQDGGVVCSENLNNEEKWTRYGVEDGLMDTPVALIATRQAGLWAVGTNGNAAATARMVGQRWHMQTHPELAQSIDRRAVFEAQDGSLWLGGAVGLSTIRGHRGGVLQFDPASNIWTHHTPPDAPLYTYSIGQTQNKALWFGGKGLSQFDGQAWSTITHIEGIPPVVLCVLGTSEGGFWVGTRANGLFYTDGQTWTQYTTRNGLSSNRVVSIHQTDPNNIWVVNAQGVERFDGQTWIKRVLPSDLLGEHTKLRRSKEGHLWINNTSILDKRNTRLWTVRHMPDSTPPETEIVVSLDEVSYPGNTTVVWQGTDRWQTTPQEDLLYAWRLDGGPWSAFSFEQNELLTLLPSGEHTFEVKARDRAFNEDPTPAVVRFTVVPPVWRQLWFIGLVAGMFLAISIQTARVILRDRQMRVMAEAANESKSVFLANMSHEIRTPMNAILGYAQILDAAENLPKEHRKAVETIEQSGEHLLGLINAILDISKIEAGREQPNPTDFNLQGLLEGLSRMFEMRCYQKRLNWKLDADIGEKYVHGDEGKLRQVLINLLGNAVKFTEFGEVKMTVEARDGNQYLFSVLDTGAGIPEDKQASIFEPFRQEKEGMRQGGTGLGLAISRRHVQLMGGDMTLVSTPGEGAQFSFTLTLPPGQAVAETETDWSGVNHLADGHSVHALVVDDVTSNREVLSQMLTMIGATVETAENGKEALDLIARKMPDIVFMDIRMPGMDGTETLAHLFERYGREATVVIAVTASVFEHQRMQYLDMGFNGFIDKPIRAEQIYENLVEHLGAEYTYAKAEESTEIPVEADLEVVDLSSELYSRLKNAAEEYSITDLRAVLIDIREEAPALAKRLDNLAGQFDMEGIQAVVEELRSES